MPTAVVTGATGFVGLNLVSKLVEAGWKVVALHRPSSDLTFLRRFDAERRVASLEDEESLRRAIPPSTEAIFHVAARVSFWRGASDDQYRTNVLGTRVVVRAALARGAGRLVHTSSVAAFGHHEGRVTEETPSNAATSKVGYLRTKYFAEEEVRKGIAAGLEATFLNPVNIIGPWDAHNWARSFRLVASGRLPGIPPGSGSFCHVEDVADAHLAAFERGRVGERYLLGGADATYLDLFRAIGRLVGKPVARRPVPAPLLQLAAAALELPSRVTGREPDVTLDLVRSMCGAWSASSDKAIRELGYRTQSLEEMLADCHAWLVRERLL